MLCVVFLQLCLQSFCCQCRNASETFCFARPAGVLNQKDKLPNDSRQFRGTKGEGPDLVLAYVYYIIHSAGRTSYGLPEYAKNSRNGLLQLIALNLAA